MRSSIHSTDEHGVAHGYHELYTPKRQSGVFQLVGTPYEGLWCRIVYHKGSPVGYTEWVYFKSCEYYIR